VEIGDFEVAGDNHKFVPATVKIEKIGDRETVVATASGVTAPKYVRYGWAGTVKSYLYNSSVLPMGTFTSDSDAEMLLQ
jgi:sialate O-acetylesterase